MLFERIEEDFKAALKAKDTVKVETLRMLKAALENFLIEKRKERADDPEIVALIQRQVQMRNDSIDLYKKAGREDLLQKEAREKSILEAYLPKALSEEELHALVQSSIQATGARSKGDRGRVIKHALESARGKADGRAVSEVATKLLQ